MKEAWRIYKNEYHRKGRSFGEILKASWKWEKQDVEARERRAKEVEEVVSKSWAEREAKTKWVEPKLKWSDCYNRSSKGHMGAQYCGD